MIVGIGVDVEEIRRFRCMKAGVRRRVLRRILTEEERDYCMRFRDPWPHVTARFCAKEALVKALGLERGVARWREVEVTGNPPRIRLRGNLLHLTLNLNVTSIHLSLSHSKHLAIAVVVLEAA